MIKNTIKTLALIFILSLSACNDLAKHYGGSVTVELVKDQKLVTCSWKGGSPSTSTSLWILTRPRREGEVAETYKYAEKSNLGLVEGSVTIIEK